MCFFIQFKHIKIVPEYNSLILGHIPVPSVGVLIITSCAIFPNFYTP